MCISVFHYSIVIFKPVLHPFIKYCDLPNGIESGSSFGIFTKTDKYLVIFLKINFKNKKYVFECDICFKLESQFENIDIILWMVRRLSDRYPLDRLQI